jgi:Flp pilus assembly protein TadG
VIKRLSDRLRANDRGAVIIYTAFFLLVLLGFVALGVDVGKAMATRTQLQRAADAAALAGASALDPRTGVIHPDTAIARAQHTASLNTAFVNDPQPVQLAAAGVEFPQPNECKVTVRRSAGSGGAMVTHIAQVLGIKSLELSATATARAEPANSVCEGLVPFGPADVPEPGFQVGCENEYRLKIGAPGFKNGNFQLLDYAPCDEGPCAGRDLGVGAEEMQCVTENGYGCCVGEQQNLETAPGNRTGPVLTGLRARWDRDTDRREGICYSEYQGNGQRVVLTPIVESFEVEGRSWVKVTSFAAFFLRRLPSGGGHQELHGEFLYHIVPGNGGGSGGTLFALRLVQ